MQLVCAIIEIHMVQRILSNRILKKFSFFSLPESDLATERKGK